MRENILLLVIAVLITTLPFWIWETAAVQAVAIAGLFVVEKMIAATI